MSGISGIYRRNQQLVDDSVLRNMLSILTHRGPDGADLWCSGSVGLCHRMLWSTPESLKEQLPAEQGGLTITADARIDNRDELIQTLHLDNTQEHTITDSDLILSAYQTWDEDCPEHLLGDFAFAIWDSRQQKLFCARDHFGVKPFYYYSADSCFVFATEIKGIFCVPEVPRQLNEARVGDYLSSMFDDVASTSYEEIFRLPPAHTLVVSGDVLRTSQYWALDSNRELPPASNEEYASQFREIFRQAVDCRLRSAYAIGTTLSGGLDSSSITCTARDLLAAKNREPLHTFSAVFSHPDGSDELANCDERKHIEPLLAQGGLESHYVQGNKLTPFERMDDMLWHQDEAFCAPNWFMTWALYGEIRRQDVRIVLSGYDGDTTVSDGYGYLSELAQAGYWLALFKEVKRLAIVFSSSPQQLFWQYFHRYGIQPLIERYRIFRVVRRSARKAARKTMHIFRPAETKLPAPASASVPWSPFLSSKLSERLDMTKRYKQWKQTQGHFGLKEKERHYRNVATQGMPPFALETMDKAMAAFGLEPRYPFWDKRLVEFCLALPSNQKLSCGWNRVIMRRAMSNTLPEAVRWRLGKADFSSNLVQGLLKDKKRLASEIARLGAFEQYLDIEAVKATYQRFLATPSRKEARQLWTVLSLTSWMGYAADNRLLSLEHVSPLKHHLPETLIVKRPPLEKEKSYC